MVIATTTRTGRLWRVPGDVPADGGILPLRFAIARETDPSAMVPHLFEEVRPDLAARLAPGDVVFVDGVFAGGKLHAQPFLALGAAGVGVIARMIPHLAVRRLVAEGVPAVSTSGDAVDIADGTPVTVDFETGVLSYPGGTEQIKGLAPELAGMVRSGGLLEWIRASGRIGNHVHGAGLINSAVGTPADPVNRPASVVEQAATRLAAAEATRVPCAPVRDLIGAHAATAYAVQRRNVEARVAAGARVVGRKIGLTAKAVQEQLGVSQPDFGVLLDDMRYVREVPLDRLLQPKAEAEIAFVLAEDLAEGPLDLVQVRAAVAYAVAALEIVDSRIAGWDITFADTVADNASSGLYVLGRRPVALEEIEPVTVTMEMTLNGEVVSTGTGAACLGDPLAALAWLARTAREFGDPLRAGQVILSGALGPMAAVRAGDTVTARLSGLGEVTACFLPGGTTEKEFG